jgi:hypothetical protein
VLLLSSQLLLQLFHLPLGSLKAVLQLQNPSKGNFRENDKLGKKKKPHGNIRSVPGSIPGHYKKKVVGLEQGPLSLVSTTEELLDRKVAAPVYKTENTAIGIHHANHVAPPIRKSWQSLRRQAAVARSV